MSKKETLFDVRVARRNIDAGLVSQEEYDKYLKSLKDATGDSTPVQVMLYPSPDDEGGERGPKPV